MGYYLTACSVKMEEVNAIYHSRTDEDDWEEVLSYTNELHLKITADKYNAYLMGLNEERRKEDTMNTALLRFVLGQTNDGEEQSKYGYLYLALCRLLGRELEPNYKMIPENLVEADALLKNQSIDIDIWNIAFRYDGVIPFGKPSDNAMWPLIGYYKSSELNEQLKKIPVELHNSHEFITAYTGWLKTALDSNDDLVLFYF